MLSGLSFQLNRKSLSEIVSIVPGNLVEKTGIPKLNDSNIKTELTSLKDALN